MKRILCIISLALVAVPALAQQGGLPAALNQINALQAQNASLQQQIANLQSSLNALQTPIASLQSSVAALQTPIAGLQSSVTALQTQVTQVGAADDGTAQALVGAWTGSVSSVEFDRSQKPPPQGSAPFFNVFSNINPTSVMSQSFTVPILGPCGGGVSGACQTGNTIVAVNPEFWVVRGSAAPDPVSMTLTRDGMNVSGTLSMANDQVAAPVTGRVLSNNFFLLRIRVPEPGPCAANGFVTYQATGSLSPDGLRMQLTGSAIQADCQHSVFRVTLAK